MERNRTQLAFGILLILLGGWFIATRQVPALHAWWVKLDFSWPLYVVGAGAVLLLMGLLLGVPGMAIPAVIVGGIGGILYYQNATNNWQSWSYMWTLIPGFVGVGNLLAGMFGGGRGYFRPAINLVVISAILFLIFGAIFGGLNLFGEYGPAILLILLGVWVIARGLIYRRSES
jgi:hypothetical protein